MLLHNQRTAPISWEAGGRTYKWDAYGACEVPDEQFEHMRAQGFPVDVTPVPPKEKASRAAAAQTKDAQVAEIERLTKALGSAEALAKEAQAATQAAEARASEARDEADASAGKARELEERVRVLQSDSAEFEKLLVEAQAESAALKQQLKSAAPAPVATAPAAPPKPTKKE